MLEKKRKKASCHDSKGISQREQINIIRDIIFIIRNKHWDTDKCENRRNGHCLGVGGKFIKVTQEEIEDQDALKTTKEVESVSEKK